MPTFMQVIRAVDAHLGNAAQIQRASTDANIPLSLGREAIAIGGGGTGGGAHTLQEWFDCSGRELGLKRILLTLLGLAGVSAMNYEGVAVFLLAAIPDAGRADQPTQTQGRHNFSSRQYLHRSCRHVFVSCEPRAQRPWPSADGRVAAVGRGRRNRAS